MFPVTMTVTIHNAAQLTAVTRLMVSNQAPEDAVAVVVTPEGLKVRPLEPAEQKPKAKAAEPKKPTPEPEQPSNPSTGTTSESEQLEAPSGTGELAGEEKAYVLADAQDLTKKVVAAGKRNEMVALLAKYEAKVAAQLKPEQIQPFCVEAEGLLK